ncbi:ankyrin [Xylaria digitata]|nr:ankyrin [Xylaria digitata]
MTIQSSTPTPELYHCFSTIKHASVRFSGRARCFKYFTDDSIFRLRLLSKFASDPVFRLSMTGDSARNWRAYFHSYVMYQVLREKPTDTSILGRIRLVSKALCGCDSDLKYLGSLVSLALGVNSPLLLENPSTYRHGRGNWKMKADIFVVAVYLGQKYYVEDDIAKGGSLRRKIRVEHVRSKIFGSAFDAATIQGNLEMIKQLLRGIPEYCEAGTVPDHILHSILRTTSMYHDSTNTRSYQAIFDFVLDTIQMKRSTTSEVLIINLLQAAEHFAAIPINFERAAAMLKSFGHHYLSSPDDLLKGNVVSGKVEMVRYLLDKGASPNPTTPDYPCYTTTLVRAINGGDDTIIRMLLDVKADIKYKAGYRESPLTAAANKGQFALTNTLLNRGVDPNEGYPPPIVSAVRREHLDIFRLLRDHGARLDTPKTGGLAMIIAETHGLSSMRDALLHEGVGDMHHGHDIYATKNTIGEGPEETKALSRLWNT